MPVDPPSIVLHELVDRCVGDASIAGLMLDAFERQASRDLAEITRLLEGGDALAASRAAHALKGAAGAVAATAIRDHAAAIELHARERSLDNASRQLDALRLEINRCLASLPQIRLTLSTGGQRQ